MNIILSDSQAYELAGRIIANSMTLTITTKKTPKSRKPNPNPRFKQIEEEDYWSMGFDSMSSLQSNEDIEYHVARYRN